MPDPEPYVPAALTGNAPADLQAETARLSAVWKLQKLVDIDAEQARDDLGAAVGADDVDRRASSAAVARRAGACVRRRRRPGRDGGREVPASLARRGESRSREGDRHVLDLHRGARPQRLDVHGADRGLDRRRLRRRHVRRRRRAERTAPRRRAGPCAADARRGREDRRSRGVRQGHPRAARPDHGLRPPRLPRRGSTITNPQADGTGARFAALRGRRGAGASRARMRSASESRTT